MKLLLDVYTSLIFRLSFALPVSFVYRKYSVRVKRKFFWGSASGTGKDEKNGRNEKAVRAERNGKAVRAGNVGQLWDWWDRERILNSEFRIGHELQACTSGGGCYLWKAIVGRVRRLRGMGLVRRVGQVGRVRQVGGVKM